MPITNIQDKKILYKTKEIPFKSQVPVFSHDEPERDLK